MALDFLSGFGPDYNDHSLRSGLSSVTLAGWTFPTTTDDAAAPPDGARWIKAEDTWSGSQKQLFPTLTPTGVSFKTYCWMCYRGWRLHGTLPAGDHDRFLSFSVAGGDGEIAIEWVRVSNTTYNLRLTKTPFRTTVATGSTAFTTDTTYSLRMELNGTTFKLWVDGTATPEIDVAYTGTLNIAQSTLMAPDASSGLQHYWRSGLLCCSNAESDRPDDQVECDTIEGSADWATEQDWGAAGDCAASSAVFGDVNLDGSAQVDTTTVWCEATAGVNNQMSETPTASPTGTPVGAVWRGNGAATFGAKTCNVNARISDATPIASNVALANFTNATFVGREAYYPLGPAGGVWSGVTLADLKLGASTPAGNNDTANLAAVLLELFSVGADPPAAAGRSRILAQVY